MRPLAFRLLRELSHERFTSGAQLAERFGVSRSAVSDALHDATEAGIGIFSLTRRGYRLAGPVELLDLDKIRAALGTHAARVDVEVIETIDSTNSALTARAAGGAASGSCIVTEMQTAGRGRRGRIWQSAPGASLTLSLLWRFEKGAAHLGGLSLAVGLAVQRTLTRLGAKTGAVTLKWPNDILAGHRKLGGVLIETQGDMLGPTAAVIGIGLNVELPAALTDAIDQPAAAVNAVLKAPVSRNALLAALLTDQVQMLDRFQADGFRPFKAEWIAAHALHQKPVRVMNGDASALDAMVRGVADDGALVVMHQGREIALNSGEVTLRGAVK